LTPQDGKHVYLAGAIEFAPDGGKGWRTDIARFLQAELGLSVFDPCVNEVALLTEDEKDNFREWKRTDRQRFLPVIRRIIDHDLDNVLHHTLFIVCLWDEHAMRGTGTAGELTVAYRHGIPVYMVLGMSANAVSSWAAGCATEVFSDFEELKRFLRAAAGGR
jgi:nucleoside 2-deoxyribosyltransferase